MDSLPTMAQSGDPRPAPTPAGPSPAQLRAFMVGVLGAYLDQLTAIELAAVAQHLTHLRPDLADSLDAALNAGVQ